MERPGVKKPTKRTAIVTRSQTFSSEGEPLPPREYLPPPKKKICYPLGAFSVLPFEINEKIISSLPVSSMASLASVSREWMKFFESWFLTPRASRFILADIKRLRSLSYLTTSENFISLCSSLGDLIRASTLLADSGAATRLFWARQIMTEFSINWRTPDDTYIGFSAFLNSCFRSSDSEELDKVTHAVLTRIRMKTYLNTQFRYGPGCRKSHEAGTRHIIRMLFTDCRLLAAALRCLTRNGKSSQLISLSNIARLVFVLYGPTSAAKPNQIEWQIVSETRTPENCMAPLGNFLNFSFWREKPFAMEDILKALLDDEMCEWSASAIGDLFVVLDNDLSIPYLMAKGNSADILVAVGKISVEAMMKLVDGLRNVLSKGAAKTLLSKMVYINVEEMATQKEICLQTCGDCKNCSICPMKVLKKIQASIEGYPPKIPETRRFSKRLSKLLSKRS